MKKLKNRGFTKTELIIVIAIVAVLAATLIPTFVSLAKNKAAQEQTNQQLADLAEKVENQQTLTIEDIKAQIAAQIAGIQLPEGVDADDVNKAIADAIAGIKIPEAGLSKDQVQTIIDNAIKNIKLPEAGLSAADVEKIVTEAIAGIKLPEGGLSADEIKQIVNEAIKGVGSSLSASDVQKIVDAAIAGLKIPENVLSAADVEKIIADAIAGIKIPEAGPTAADVEKMINDAIAAALQNIKPGVTDAELKAAIEAAIKEALAQLEGTYLTDDQIQALIDKALAGLKPEETEPEETKPAAPVVSSVALNNTYLELAIGTAAHLKATAYDQYGNVVADAVIRWSSHNTVCTFVNNGMVYAIAPGTTVVTATVEGTDIFANCYVVVTGNVVPDPSIVPVQSVVLDKTSATLTVGDTTTLVATVIPTNATNVAVVWTSSNTAVATVKNGVVTAVGAGTATITVTTVDGNKTATCAVTVKASAPADTRTLEERILAGGVITLTEDSMLTQWVSATEDAVIDLNGYTLTLPANFYCIDVWSDFVIKNGTIVSYGANQLYVVHTGSLVLENVNMIRNNSTAAAVVNRGTLVVDGCRFVNNTPDHNNLVLSNGMTFDSGFDDQHGNMTISNTVIEGEFVRNICVIMNWCGTITFGENVVINAVRPEGNMFADDIVESEDTLKGSAIINGELVIFD